MLNAYPDYIRSIANPVQQSYIDSLLERESARQQEYIQAREYYDGLHKTQLTDRMRQFLQAKHDTNFNVNYCPMVVNAKADRLKVTGLEIDEKAKQKDTLWNWWRKNRLDRIQGIVHRSAIRDGDSFVLVEWDSVAQMPRFYYESAYAGDGVMVYYSEERRDDIEFASKTWQIKYGSNTGKMVRKNLYFADRIEKYMTHSDIAYGHWQPHQDDTTVVMPGRLGMAGVNWWTDTGAEFGKPLGVPIVHFKHNDNGDQYGTSHLADVMPIQDAVNKAMIDLLGAMDANGFPLLVGTGTDAWTQAKVGPGAVAAVNKPSSEADLKAIPPMNPSGLLAVYNALVMEIGRVSGTPLSYFQTSGHVAAEGTMKQQEIALVTQIEKAQTDFGNAWEDCFNIARRLHNAFSTEAPMDEEELIDTVWEQAESRNDKEQAETLSIRVQALGVSEEQAQLEMGYDADDIAAFRKAALKKQADAIRNQVKMGINNPQAGQQNMTQTENENDNSNTTNGNTQAKAA
jgi:hypothetical protein